MHTVDTWKMSLRSASDTGNARSFYLLNRVPGSGLKTVAAWQGIQWATATLAYFLEVVPKDRKGAKHFIKFDHVVLSFSTMWHPTWDRFKQIQLINSLVSVRVTKSFLAHANFGTINIDSQIVCHSFHMVRDI